MAIFSDELEKMNLNAQANTRWLRIPDLIQGEWGLSSVKIIVPSSPRYGATRQDSLYQRGILKEGETIEYVFINSDDEEKIFESKSIVFYSAIRRANIQENEKFKIIKEGSGSATRYHVDKVAPPLQDPSIPNSMVKPSGLTQEQEDSII